MVPLERFCLYPTLDLPPVPNRDKNCQSSTPQDCFDRPDQGFHIGRRPNRNAQIISQGRLVEPAHENFSLMQFSQPLARGKLWRLSQDEIGLARKRLESKRAEFAAKPIARGSDPVEVGAVIWQV